jgi:hypothetical protein
LPAAEGPPSPVQKKAAKEKQEREEKEREVEHK